MVPVIERDGWPGSAIVGNLAVKEPVGVGAGMVVQISSQLTRRISHSMRVKLIGGIQQKARRFRRRTSDNHQVRMLFMAQSTQIVILNTVRPSLGVGKDAGNNGVGP